MDKETVEDRRQREARTRRQTGIREERRKGRGQEKQDTNIGGKRKMSIQLLGFVVDPSVSYKHPPLNPCCTRNTHESGCIADFVFKNEK